MAARHASRSNSVRARRCAMQQRDAVARRCVRLARACVKATCCVSAISTALNTNARIARAGTAMRCMHAAIAVCHSRARATASERAGRAPLMEWLTNWRRAEERTLTVTRAAALHAPKTRIAPQLPAALLSVAPARASLKTSATARHASLPLVKLGLASMVWSVSDRTPKRGKCSPYPAYPHAAIGCTRVW